MTGFEGIGDFDSDDPWQRHIAHQAAKGNYPRPVFFAVPDGEPTDACALCGIHRKHAGNADACGDGYLQAGCFSVEVET